MLNIKSSKSNHEEAIRQIQNVWHSKDKWPKKERKGEKRKHKTTGFSSSNNSKAEQNNTKSFKKTGEI